ncbi:hypothetical protein FHX08_005337 [Rhizobium sp. BK529]|nr:hypothetical protein [Rhizobium sp. BK529]
MRLAASLFISGAQRCVVEGGVGAAFDDMDIGEIVLRQSLDHMGEDGLRVESSLSFDGVTGERADFGAAGARFDPRAAGIMHARKSRTLPAANKYRRGRRKNPLDRKIPDG